MKNLGALLIVFAAVVVAAGQGGDKDKYGDKPVESTPNAGGITFRLDGLRESMGLNAKAVKMTPTGYAILLEFTKECDADEVKEAFRPSMAATEKGDTRVAFLLKDEDNVIIGRKYASSVEGEITGRKGDAFRVILLKDASVPTKVKQIEARGPRLYNRKDK